MANQTTSKTLDFLNEAEKTRLQEMYQMVNSKQGNMPAGLLAPEPVRPFVRAVCDSAGRGGQVGVLTARAAPAASGQVGAGPPGVLTRMARSLIGQCRSPQRRRHGPGSGSVRAASVTRWRPSVRAVCRVGQSRGEGPSARRPAVHPYARAVGTFPRQAGRSVRVVSSESVRTSVRSVRELAGSWGTNRTRRTPRRCWRRCSRGSDSDGALTDPGAMGY